MHVLHKERTVSENARQRHAQTSLTRTSVRAVSKFRGDIPPEKSYRCTQPSLHIYQARNQRVFVHRLLQYIVIDQEDYN